MKKIISVLTVLSFLAVTFTGCTNQGKRGGGVVAVDGSTSVEKVIGYLSESYMEENSDVRVTYNPTGSGSGIQAVLDGRCDIGLSSRNLKDKEKDELVGTVVAIDGIAVIVNLKNPVKNLTLEQVAAVYRGDIKNWNELGGDDSPIVPIGREAASGTRDGFESLTGTKDSCKYSQELTSTGDVVQTVSSNPNAIGYTSLAAVKDTVKAIDIDGVTPTIETIQNGTYKIQRNFLFVTKKNTELPKEAKKFFDFATSSEAEALIIKAGAVPAAR